ncbi:MAG: PKD domain-containing protein [Lewinellaceae bacterium]|nr:PKD domain-containing protein [Lewinellaceae bacterium]
MLDDPDALLTRLAGTSSKTWYLQREGVALGIGPVPGDNAWWSFGGVTPLGDRPCILDDQFTFHRDGTWEFNSNNTIFIDSKGNGGWFADGVPEGCHNEDEPGVWTSENGDDLSAFASGGDYTYEFDATAGTLTILGAGAYIGLPNKTATGDNYIPQTVKEYQVFHFTEGAIADSLQVALTDGNISWNFYLVSYHNPADLPDIPSALPAANFSFEKDGYNVTFTNLSKNSTTYIWDFGDGATSTETNPVHTYAGEGDYTVTLTAKDDMGNSDEKSAVVSISSAVFTAAALSSETGKIWRLANQDGCYKVGPSAGSGEWWSVGAADLTARACQLDDEFIFFNAGDYNIDTKGTTWAEEYMAVSPGACTADGDIPAPYDGLASGSHTFEVTGEGTDAKIRVIGTGAYFGFSKAYNGGEYNGGDAELQTEITYNVYDYSVSGNVETLILAVDIAGDGTAWWTITVVSEN